MIAQEKNTDLVIDYIFDTAKELGCYVTLERTNDLDGRSQLRNAYVPLGKKVKTVEQFIEKLRKDLKTVTVVRNKANPKILHLIEDGLQGQTGYPLDEKASVEFKGVLSELAYRIGEKVPGIQMGVLPTSEMFDDGVTKVVVNVKGMPVRDILTKAVPLHRYGPLLWAAQTQKEDGKFWTMIQYYGPREEFWPKPGSGPTVKEPAK